MDNVIVPVNPSVTKTPDFDPIVATLQARSLGIDFGLYLDAGVTLTGTPTLTLSVVSGVDATPAARLTTGPTVGTITTDNGGTGVASAAIKFQLSDLQPNTKYLLTF